MTKAAAAVCAVEREPVMDHMRLANGILMPQMGIGIVDTFGAKAAEDAVKAAIEAGFRHICSSMIYGREKSIARGIRNSGIKREELFMTAVLWNDDIRTNRARQAFRQSLAELETDYVDMYMVNWPVDGFEKAWKSILDYYAEGRIRSLGVRNFQLKHIKSLMRETGVLPHMIQTESCIHFRDRKFREFCGEKNIAMSVWDPPCSAELYRKLAPLSERLGREQQQIVIRSCIQSGFAVMPKATGRESIFAGLSALDFKLSDHDMAIIAEAYRDE